MLKFLNIRIKGFASYEGDNELSLDPNSAVVIKAPNGSGKSTIFSALVWCLYGKTIKGVSDVNTKKKYRTKEYKGTMVEVFFQKNESLYKVIRCQNYTGTIEDGAKGGDRLLILEDANILDIKGKVKLQEYLNNTLALSYQLFMNSIMFGQGIKKLIQETNSDKKKLFEEVFNLNYLNKAKSLAQHQKESLMSDISVLETEYRSLNSEYNSLVESYNSLLDYEKSYKNEKLKELSFLKKERKSIKSSLLNAETLLRKYDIDNLTKELAKYEKELNNTKHDIEQARNISNQPLIKVVDKVIKLLKNKEVDKAYKVVLKIKKSFIDYDTLNTKKNTLYENISSVKDKLNDFNRSKANYNSISRKLSDIKSNINRVREKLNDKPKNDTKKLLNKSNDIKAELSRKKVCLESLRKDLDNYEWLLNDPLSNKGIKAYLFDSSLTLLNETLANYSDILGFKIHFEIDLDSTKKDFVTIIEMDGELYDYDELSGGQQQLCNVAMAFAMNESLTASNDINMAFLDEVFESLSSDNIEIVIGLIKNIFKDKTLFLITHHESLPLSKFKTLKVERLQGRSSFKLL